MKKKVIFWVVAICVVCILARLFIARQEESEPKKSVDFASIAKKASKTQGKLVVMRIYATTTIYRENRSTFKETACVGYVHEGNADIVVDLTKADFQYQDMAGSTNLVITVPPPELDRASIGIDPSKLKRVTSIPRADWRTQRVYTNLEDECKNVITQKQHETFSSADVLEDAKTQARRVLTNFYQKCVNDQIAVDVEFSEKHVPYSPNPDVKPVLPGQQ